MKKVDSIELDADKWDWLKNNLSKEIFEKIQNLIGKELFFVSYSSLSYLLSNLTLR